MFEIKFTGLNTLHPVWKDKRYFVAENCNDPNARAKNVACIYENHIKYIFSQSCDLGFLADCPDAEFVICPPGSTSLQTLCGLKKLKGLALATDDLSFDFAALESLEFLSTSPEAKNKSWLRSESLSALSFPEYRLPDLSLLGGSDYGENLRYLEILFSPARFRSLGGIGALTRLKSLAVTGCSRLADARELFTLSSLKTLVLSDNPRLKEFEWDKLVSLEELRLWDSQTARARRLPTLAFLRSMPAMKRFSTDWVVEDGDLTPLLALEDADVCRDHRHYNLKRSMLPRSAK